MNFIWQNVLSTITNFHNSENYLSKFFQNSKKNYKLEVYSKHAYYLIIQFCMQKRLKSSDLTKMLMLNLKFRLPHLQAARAPTTATCQDRSNMETQRQLPDKTGQTWRRGALGRIIRKMIFAVTSIQLLIYMRKA